MKVKTYKQLEDKNHILTIVIVFMIAAILFLAWYTNGLRVDNIAKNKQVAELSPYKQAWLDFNETHMPETALPRYHNLEDMK